MKKCGYCGRDNSIDAIRCLECGMEDFVSPASVREATLRPADNVSELPWPEPDVTPDGESSICPSCLFPNLPDVTWCKRCDAPLGLTTAIVPTDAAYSVGYIYRRAISGRPKIVVLLGIWAVFFPGLMYNFGLLLAVLSGTVTGPGLVTFWLGLGGGTICYIMLYRVTKNFLTIPPKVADEGAV